MSTGLECQMIEVEPSKWYLILEDGSAPKNAWDWREFALAYGPFKTEDETDEFLRDNFANPGGYWTQNYKQGFRPDETLQKLLADAPANKRRFGGGGFHFYSNYPSFR